MNMLRRSTGKLSRRYFSSQLPEPHRNPKIPKTQLFINNEWVDSLSGETFKTINPTTSEVIAEVQKGGKADVDRAVQAAKEAFKLGSPWRKMDAAKRGRLINKLADLMERDSVYLSSLEALECGKVYSATLKGDLPWAVRNLRYFGGYADKNNGITAAIDGNFITYTRHEPVGVCGLITAWNFSILMVSWKLAPALAAGCTMVLKPSQHTSLAALHVAELVKEAGFPPGVINFVPGFGEVGSAMVTHPDVDKISFTGSTEVGKQIFKNGAENMKRLTLELGGKSPNIILPDADIDNAVEHAHYAAFHNMGQCCCAGSRTFVHESIYEKFLEKSKARIKAKRVGDPFDLNVEHGPQATKDQMDIVMRMIESGKKEGATVEVGGNRLDRPGFFVEPTLFTNVKDDMTISKEEIFGPVQQIISYKTIDEVIERANNTEYGLASSIYGQNLDQINTITQGLRAGSVWVNCYFIITPQTPFGGYKMSGLGREGGPYGIEAFTEVKSVFMKTPTKNS
ncbi:aldehyde dehydrogenase, mitochondrial [Halyomorpha halys]|uniref:aldehyde dehydrogenase, mitochondrial n=1 Tax=Halyomorpha halys TaxID=286706 RepID=UPI0006D4DA9E|nr:aldehyde dehydrogenase, mitochondrial-like [Halyomorpha halys]